MSLNAKNAPGASNIEPIEAGTYPGRLVQVLDMGLQTQRPFNGEDKKPAYEIGLTYELVDEFMKDDDGNDILDKPRWVSETMAFYNLEQEKANSTKRYMVLDPDVEYEGNFPALLDTAINVTVTKTPGKGKNANKIYNNVSGISIMRQRDRETCPALVNEAVFFDLDAPDMKVFKSLTQWVREKIQSNLEFQGSRLQAAIDTMPADTPVPAKEEGAEEEAPY